MTPRQHDTAMIHHLCRDRSIDRETGTRQQRPAASRTPIRQRLIVQHRMAMTANPFHTSKNTGSYRFR